MTFFTHSDWLLYVSAMMTVRRSKDVYAFGKTHHFLPIRNRPVPNTAHIMLHVATAATLFSLLVN